MPGVWKIAVVVVTVLLSACQRSAEPSFASDLGALATEARPGLLVLYHGLFYGVPEAVVLDEVRTTYDGEVVLADDLDLF